MKKKILKKEILKMKREGIGNRRFLINKKGGAFAIGMVITVIFLIGFTWHGFVLANRKIDSGVSSLENITDIYMAGDRLSFYLKEASKLSIQQSFNSIIKEAAIDIDKQGEDCFTKKYKENDIRIWEEKCKPHQAFIEEKFLLEYDKNFGVFLDNYPEKIEIKTSYNMENNSLTTMAKTILTGEQKASYAIYNLSYKLNEDITLNLTTEQICFEDFSNIYDKTSSKLEECKEKTAELTDIKKCLEELSFKRWDFNAVVFDTWVLFEFNTKRNFFFEDENKIENFEQIELKFGLQY